MNALFIMALVLFAFATGFFIATLPQSADSTLAIILFFAIGGLTLASFWMPQLRIVSFALVAITFAYGWVSTGNNWFLVGALGMAIPAVVFATRL